MPMSIKAATQIAGTLGASSKMPGSCYGLPAAACKTGSKLAKIAGTACSVCYALRGHYTTPNVAKSQQRRLEAIQHPLWVEAMVTLLRRKHQRKWIRVDLGIKNAKARGIVRTGLVDAGFHRWFDSGDLQSVKHLAMICEVAHWTPKIKHWLPTQELGFVHEYLGTGQTIPPNLVIRVSDVMLDAEKHRAWATTSGVIGTKKYLKSDLKVHVCPAPQNDHKCGTCRACWSPQVPHVSYVQH